MLNGDELHYPQKKNTAIASTKSREEKLVSLHKLLPNNYPPGSSDGEGSLDSLDSVESEDKAHLNDLKQKVVSLKIVLQKRSGIVLVKNRKWLLGNEIY